MSFPSPDPFSSPASFPQAPARLDTRCAGLVDVDANALPRATAREAEPSRASR